MSKRKKPPTEPFRRSQVVSPVPSGRRFGKAKFEKKTFDIYVSDIESGDETLAITVFAGTQREAIQIARKRLQSSPVLRKITYAVHRRGDRAMSTHDRLAEYSTFDGDTGSGLKTDGEVFDTIWP